MIRSRKRRNSEKVNLNDNSDINLDDNRYSLVNTNSNFLDNNDQQLQYDQRSEFFRNNNLIDLMSPFLNSDDLLNVYKTNKILYEQRPQILYIILVKEINYIEIDEVTTHQELYVIRKISQLPELIEQKYNVNIDLTCLTSIKAIENKCNERLSLMA